MEPDGNLGSDGRGATVCDGKEGGAVGTGEVVHSAKS